MGIPDVNETIQDGALGIVGPSAGQSEVKIGPCAIGLVNSVVSCTQSNFQALIGPLGPTSDAVACDLSEGGGALFVVPVNPSTYGTCSSPVLNGTGAETLSATPGPCQSFVLKATVSGAVGVSRLALSLDGGATFGPDFLSAATVQLPGFSHVTIAVGSGSAVVGDTWTVSTVGVITTGGTGTLAITLSSVSPLDAYSVVVTLTKAGALGAAQFTYSLDGGATVSGAQLVPSGGKFPVPQAGFYLTFGGTSTAGDVWTLTTTGASYNSTDLTNAFNALIGTTTDWSLLHVVGAASSSSAAASLLASLDTLMSTAAAGFKMGRAVIENPQDSDSSTQSAYASSSSLRVGVGAGFYVQASPINGIQLKRNVAWRAMARLRAVRPGVDAAEVDLGSCPGVVSLVRDENLTPGLDAARFITMRTFTRKQGFFITNARLMAPTGSDYTYFVAGRVMDEFAPAVRLAALNYLNKSVPVSSTTGKIVEQSAQQIEGAIDSAARAVVTQPGDASNVIIQVDRNTNILSTGNLPITGRVVPLGYIRAISAALGFFNPALQQKSF